MEEVTDEYEEQGRFDSISIEPIPTRNNRLSGSAASNISIESFQIIEERVRKHVAYKITGEENNAKFEVSRRYKEFRILHRILSQLWPGCYIPKIPKKKAVGNMKIDFIDKRKKLLELFLIKLCSQPCLYGSEAFALFLKSPVNFSKCEKDIKIPSCVEISLIYQDVFREFTYFQSDLQQKSEVREYLKEFQEISEVLAKVKHLAKLSFHAFAKYEESINGLISGIKLITPMFLMNKNLNLDPKENYVNPYTSIREWLRADILDAHAMIETIMRYIQLEDDVGNIEVKIEKKKKGLEQVQGGKKSLSQRLSSKTQESRIAEEEKKIEELENNKEAFSRIGLICLGKLLQSDIPKFKQQKVYKICVSMRNYSKTTVQEYQEIAEQILQIEENLAN